MNKTKPKPEVRIVKEELLSDNWYVLKKVTFEYEKGNGKWESARLLDKETPETSILREMEEETGYRINSVQKIGEAYMSPGSVTEILHFFVAEYDDDMAIGAGGGLDEEQENIEGMELPYRQALPVLGEWYALPLITTAGSQALGYEIFTRIFHPSSIRLLDHCDAVLRIGSASAGADEMVRIAREKGLLVYERVEELPLL